VTINGATWGPSSTKVNVAREALESNVLQGAIKKIKQHKSDLGIGEAGSKNWQSLCGKFICGTPKTTNGISNTTLQLSGMKPLTIELHTLKLEVRCSNCTHSISVSELKKEKTTNAAYYKLYHSHEQDCKSYTKKQTTNYESTKNINIIEETPQKTQPCTCCSFLICLFFVISTIFLSWALNLTLSDPK